MSYLKMPFKSYKQFKKFASLVNEGTISKKTFDEFAKETDFARLPIKVKKPIAVRSSKKV